MSSTLVFACPACGSSECTLVGEGLATVLDFPVSCSGCGARARLRGMRVHLCMVAALIAVIYALYFEVVPRLVLGSSLLAYVAVGLLVMAFVVGEGYSRRRLLRWELGTPEQVPDETSFLRGLRKYWVFLIGPALFGPCIALLGGFHVAPYVVIAILFFGVLVSAMLPVFSGRAPFSFGLLAIALLAAGSMAL